MLHCCAAAVAHYYATFTNAPGGVDLSHQAASWCCYGGVVQCCQRCVAGCRMSKVPLPNFYAPTCGPLDGHALLSSFSVQVFSGGGEAASMSCLRLVV